MSNQTVTLDVRDDIRNGREPFSRIMGTVAGLQAGDKLLLIAPFEPVPLFGVLEKQGFSHTARPTGSGDWEVLFTRESTTSGNEPDNFRRSVQSVPPSVVEVDARGLEPPQPLVKILETVAGLPQGAELRARTDRRPLHLYAQLEQRGFLAETQEQPDGSFVTHVRRQ